MILITVGSSHFPFDRLLSAIDLLKPDEELVVQHGPSSFRPRRARCVAYLPFSELTAEALRARAIVCHGGIGSILVALAAGKRPLVVPRQARFGETVDDHQVDSVRALAGSGLVTAVLDPEDLGNALACSDPSAPATPPEPGLLRDELRDYIRAAVGGAA